MYVVCVGGVGKRIRQRAHDETSKPLGRQQPAGKNVPAQARILMANVADDHSSAETLVLRGEQLC
jgi:hypothetical protein